MRRHGMLKGTSMILRRVVGNVALGLVLALVLLIAPTLHLAKAREPVAAGDWKWPGVVPQHWPTSPVGAFSSFNERRVAFGLTELYVGVVTGPIGGDVFEFQRLEFGVPLRAAYVDLRMEHRPGLPSGTRDFPKLAMFDQGFMLRPLDSLPFRGWIAPLRIHPVPFVANWAVISIAVWLFRRSQDAIRSRWIRPMSVGPSAAG
jgi:hypothetical protein